MPPVVARYEPRGAALELFRARNKEIVIAGQVGTGKSRADLEKLHACALKYSGFRGLMTRKTRVSMSNTMLVTWGNHVTEGFFPTGPSRAHRTSYVYPNGSEIDLLGLDNPDRIMSSEYDMILVGECVEASEEDWEKLITRLRNGKMPYQQIVGDCNPDAPTHWIKRREAEGKLLLLESRLVDNPRFYDARKGEWTPEGVLYLENLESLTGHRRERLLEGKWVSPEGARWPYLRRGEHTFDRREVWPHGLPESFKVIIGIDYGIRAPYCALWVAVDFDGDLYVFREDYEPGLGAWEQAQRVVDLTGRNERIHYVFADPACWAEMIDKDGRTGVSTADYYDRAFRKDERFGPLLKGFNKSRRSAMDTLDLLLTRGNGHPDLWIEEHCVNLWREMNEAVWDSRNPIKEDLDPACSDHAITALYYAVHTYINAPNREDGAMPTAAEVAHAWAQERNERAIKRFNRTADRRFRL